MQFLGAYIKPYRSYIRKRTIGNFYQRIQNINTLLQPKHKITSETKEYITQEGLDSSNAKIFPKGTLCIALYGATIGRLGILGINAATNQAICGIFLPEWVDTKYIFYFFI